MKLPELRKSVFWDNNVWLCLFAFGNESDSARERSRREFLEQRVLPAMESDQLGVVFSPMLYADVPKNVELSRFEASVSRLRDYGYVSLVENLAAWDRLAQLREGMRKDITRNSVAFQHIPPAKQNVSLGDTGVVFVAIQTGCSELWTYDPLLLAFSKRSSVRGLTICEPHIDDPQLRLPNF